MTRALLFPGQGTDLGDSVRAWAAESPCARDLVALVAAEIALPLQALLGGGRVLERTEVLQPMLTALCLAAAGERAERGEGPDVVAGHSLGEIAACSAAGAMEPAAAVVVAAHRGRLMARLAAAHPGGMIALHVDERAEVEEAVASARAHGVVDVAAHNAPGEWAVSGEWPALRAIAAHRRATVLPVAGPWHGRALAEGVAEYAEALRAAVRGRLRVPLVANRTGQAVRDARCLPELLAGQLTHPVAWVASMHALRGLGVDTVVTAGPARGLRSLVRRCLGDSVSMVATDVPADLGPTPRERAS